MTFIKKAPYRIDAKKGQRISFCTCCRTTNPPFCDGSHKGLGIEPFRVTFEEDKKISICGCSKSKNMPYCDGSHKCDS